jgi:hypothetical protein
MPIDFDDLNAIDDLNPAPRIGPEFGLVVAEKAKPGDLEVEFARFQKEGPPPIIFEETDDDTGETTVTVR